MAWEPMKAQAAAGIPPHPEEYAFEFKWDGMRALVDTAGGRLRIVSRNAIEQAARFPELAGIAQACPDAALDGEIVAFDEAGVPSFYRLQERMHVQDLAVARARVATRPVHFVAFDLLRLGPRDLTREPYRERRRVLESIGFRGPHWQVTPVLVGDGESMLAASRDARMEGIIAKRLDSRYVPGRSPEWLKVRNRDRQEFVVAGWTEGEGSRSLTIGSLLVGYYQGRRLRFAGRVGAGLKDADLDVLDREFARLAAPASPFDAVPRKPGETVHYVRPQLVAEVEFNGLAGNGVLRQPSFKGLRIDKPAARVVWEQAHLPAPHTVGDWRGAAVPDAAGDPEEGEGGDGKAERGAKGAGGGRARRPAPRRPSGTAAR